MFTATEHISRHTPCTATGGTRAFGHRKARLSQCSQCSCILKSQCIPCSLHAWRMVLKRFLPFLTDKPPVASQHSSSSSPTFSRAIAKTTAANGLPSCRYVTDLNGLFISHVLFELDLCFCRTVILICRCMPRNPVYCLSRVCTIQSHRLHALTTADGTDRLQLRVWHRA